MTLNLDQHIANLRQALLIQDAATAATERDWLMGEITAALLEQDEAAMNALRDHLADLAPLADHYGDALPGDRWRAAWEILHAFCATVRPLEQARLAAPNQLSGQLLRHIADTPGITPSALSVRVKKKINHVSNTLKALAEQGLVHRIQQGRTGCYYLAEMGRMALGQQPPPAEAEAAKPAQPGNVINLAHVKEERLQRRNTRELPSRWSGNGMAQA